MAFSLTGAVDEGRHSVGELVGDDGGVGGGCSEVEGSVGNSCSIIHRAVASIDEISKNEPACREYDDYS